MLHLWITLFLIPVLPGFHLPVDGGPWLRVEVTMEEDGFMCPFLTPQFMRILEDKGADWVRCRPQDSAIDFCVPLEHARSPEGYSEWLTGLGYSPQHIHFLQFDTLSVMPQLPAP